MNPLSALFGAAVAVKNGLYDRGSLQQHKLRGPVVSIGNLSVGGTGKTPFTITLGENLKARQIEFDILSRGYGRHSKGTLHVTADIPATLGGDEPVLLARRLGVPVVVSELRARAGEFAEANFGARLHLLDDGFQHRQLHRQFDIVLLGPNDVRDTLLPIGRQREPLSSLKRADAVVVDESFSEAISGYSGPIWRVRRKLSVEGAAPRRPFVFCGIANPQRFLTQLRDIGITPAGHLLFRDHHRYTADDLLVLEEKAKAVGADGLLTTEKDMVKLRELGSLPNVSVARLAVELLDAERCIDRMFETVRQRCPDWYAR